MYGILKIGRCYEQDIEELKEKFLQYLFEDSYKTIYQKYKEKIDYAFELMIINSAPTGWTEPCLVEAFGEFFSIYTDYDECGDSKYVKLYKEGIQEINGQFYSCFIFKYDKNYYNSLQTKNKYNKLINYDYVSEAMLDVYYDTKCEVVNLFIKEIGNINEIMDFIEDDILVHDAFSEFFDTRKYHVVFEFSETIDSNIEAIDDDYEEENDPKDNINESVKVDVKTYKGLYYFVNDNNEITITSGDKPYNKKVLNIPKTIDGRLVTTIDTGAFQGNETIEEVFIPDTIDCINDFAFSSCKKLEKIHIDNDVKTVFPNAFSNSPLLLFVYGPTQKKDMFEWAAGQMVIETPRRNTIDDNWLDNMFSGFYITNHPKKSVLTGFDDDYDGFGKDIKISKEGFPYFLNDDNEAIITRHITIKEDNIVVPNEVDGYKVVAIGSYAFTNASYSSIIIPESVEVVAAGAFFNTSFDYLRLPKELKYLNESFICNNRIPLPLLKQRIKDNDEVINNPYFIIMPEEIQQLDAGIIDKYRLEGHTLVFEKTPKYKDKYEEFNCSILNTSVFYDNDSKSIYIIKDNNACILSNYQIDKKDKIPKEIDSYPVTMLDSNYLSEAGGYVTYEEKSNNSEDNWFIHGNILKIPSFITKITNCFGINASVKSSEINNSKLQIIDGINISDYFILPKTVREIRNVTGVILVPKDMEAPLIENCDSVYYNFIEVEEDESFNYAIIEKNDELLAIAFNKKTKYDVCTLNSYINEKKIMGCIINASNISLLKINNIFYEDNIKEFNFNIEDITKIAIGENIKKVKDIYNFIVSEEIKDIYVNNGVEEFLDKSKPNGNILDYSISKNVFLPKSIKRIGMNAFGSDISMVKLNSEPEIASNAFVSNTYIDSQVPGNYNKYYSQDNSINNTTNTLNDANIPDENESDEVTYEKKYIYFLKMGNIFNVISILLGVITFILSMCTGFFGTVFFVFVCIVTIGLSGLLLVFSRLRKNSLLAVFLTLILSLFVAIGVIVNLSVSLSMSHDSSKTSLIMVTIMTCLYFAVCVVIQTTMYFISIKFAKKLE